MHGCVPLINMDVQGVSDICKCVMIIFHIVVAGTYICIILNISIL